MGGSDEEVEANDSNNESDINKDNDGVPMYECEYIYDKIHTADEDDDNVVSEASKKRLDELWQRHARASAKASPSGLEISESDENTDEFDGQSDDDNEKDES